LEKLDLMKQYRHLYQQPRSGITDVDVPQLPFLMLDGQGSPGSEAYGQAVGALYSLAYTLKFAVKLGQGIDYKVMPLEGLWWADDLTDFVAGNKDAWKWTAMILVPDFVTQAQLSAARTKALEKKGIPAIRDVRLEMLHEGLSAQTLYVGPYADETETIQRIHQFIHDKGLELRGKHHEIYLSDPNRTAPEKLKTVIRQPYGPAGAAT
jgi:hypothetical protein